MEQVLPTLGLLAIVGVTLFAYHLIQRRVSARRPPGELKGFGGWLALIVIGQTIAPVWVAVEVVQSIEELQPIRKARNGEVVFFAYFAMAAALIVLQIWVTVLMYRKRKIFPEMFLAQYAGVVALYVLLFGYFYFGLQMSLQGLIEDRETRDALRSLVRGAGVTGVWYLYLKASKRARNTFVN